MGRAKKPNEYIYHVTTYPLNDPENQYKAYVNWQHLSPKIQEVFERSPRKIYVCRRIKRPDGRYHMIRVQKMKAGG